MKIYLDVSCLNRPFDDQWQERIRIEAEAVTLIIEGCSEGRWRHVSSAMALIEINANPDPDKRRKARAILPKHADIIPLNEAIFERAELISAMGFHVPDAVHIAAAEAVAAAILLTCDDRLLRAARRNQRRLSVVLANPVPWLREQSNAKNT